MLAKLGTALLVHGEPEASAGLAEALPGAGLSRGRIALPSLDQRFDLAYRDGCWVASVAASGEPRLTADLASAPRDWHNDYAQTLLDLRAALNKAPDDASRHRLLQELRRLIGSGR
jgi:metallo-beta-lactamase family protein